MDGKKVKVLTLTASGGLQDNDTERRPSADSKVECVMPKCARLTFVYKPAKGVTGGLMMTANWGNPLSDIDLYFGEIDKKGRTSVIGACGGAGAPHEKVYAAASSLRSGHTYALIAYFARSINDTVTIKAEIGKPNSIGKTLPAQVDSLANTNCTL